MTSFLELKNEVCSSIGRPGDPDALSWAGRAVNAGVTLVGLIYEPEELRQIGSLSPLNGVERITLNTLTRPLRIEDVYNETEGVKVWPIEYRSRNSLPLPSSGPVLFFALYSSWMYFNPIPSSNLTLRISYLQYAARLVNNTDLYPYARYEDFVLTFANALAFAFLEEGESSDVWMKVGQNLGLSEAQITQTQRVLRGEVDLGKLQRALSTGNA